MKSFLISVPLIALCAACTVSYSPSTPSPISPAPFTTFTPIPILTNAPTLPPVVTPTAVLSPFVPFYVKTWADNVILRADPGYLFTPRTTLKKGTSLLLLGRSPGGEWFFVQIPDSRAGWVFAQLVDVQGDLNSAPIIQPADAQLVRGRVVDDNGQPISGIQFSLVQGGGVHPPRNDAMTDDNGNFYAFMPLTASGQWTVGYTAVACTSNTMDVNCNCKNGACGKPYPEVVNITLPHDGILDFVWR